MKEESASHDCTAIALQRDYLNSLLFCGNSSGPKPVLTSPGRCVDPCTVWGEGEEGVVARCSSWCWWWWWWAGGCCCLAAAWSHVLPATSHQPPMSGLSGAFPPPPLHPHGAIYGFLFLTQEDTVARSQISNQKREQFFWPALRSRFFLSVDPEPSFLSWSFYSPQYF